MTIDRSASSRKIRQKRRIVECRGLGTGSGRGLPLGIALPFGRAKWDYQADKRRVMGGQT
jgi:hypothetical protein